jgi:hypothetical protein
MQILTALEVVQKLLVYRLGTATAIAPVFVLKAAPAVIPCVQQAHPRFAATQTVISQVLLLATTTVV